jgi:hypothetical protein
MTQSLRWLLIVPFLISAAPVHGDEKNRREQAVRDDKQGLGSDARWLYNDLETGFDAAKKLNKPLLVVLRCVPCKACTGIDESVLRAKELQPLLDGFVCVRLINANAIDLSRFQFDYDLSFSTLVFHPEGKLIGRYGSWQHQIDEMETSTASLQAMLRRSKLLFDNWGVVKDQLAPSKVALPHSSYRSKSLVSLASMKGNSIGKVTLYRAASIATKSEMPIVRGTEKRAKQFHKT